MTPDALRNLAGNVIAGIIFTVLGVVLFVSAFMLFDRLTPGTLWKELLEDQNTAIGILMGCIAIALAIIIAAAVHCGAVGMDIALFLSVLLIAACGLIYELVASALASYLLGDSVMQFSTVIGTYLFAMGIGSWWSRYLTRGLVARFISIELMVGVIGGFSSTVLFLAFAYTSAFRLVLY